MTAVRPEEARLQALYQYRVLDTPPEQAFDDLVWLAAHVCGTPASLVSLVDRDRLWFKGAYGVEMSEAPRHHAFCSAAIEEAPNFFVVHDAAKDERFASNDIVRNPPYIRFYAGAPLINPEGFALGTLCVLDTVPRKIDEEQRHCLRILSRHVMSELELRRNVMELRQSAEELTEANNELEGFSHAISHDLRSSLRTTTNCAKLLRFQASDRLEPKSQELLRMIEQKGERTSDMLEDFLRLLRLRKQPLHPELFEMRELVDKVVADLKLQHGDHPATFNVGPLPPIGADRGLIWQVWENLLSNAIKFSHNHTAPVINIGATVEPMRVVYFVQDNGAGFRSDQTDQLWIPFQRLHGNEFEGTGLGLSIVQRIVMRHGGIVWAESRPNAGATFYFALPRPIEEQVRQQAAA